MSRFLTLLLLGIAAYVLYKRVSSSKSKQPAPPPVGDEKMCKCSYCSAHAPQKLGVTNSEGQFFCSAEHQRLYLTKQNQHPME